MKALRRAALRYPDTHEGISCEGTSLEKRTVKAHKKAFVFLGEADLMVKLRESLPEAKRLAAKQPERYRAGAHGWVKATFAEDELAPMALLERWIDESYRVVVNGKPDRIAKKKRP
jgi:predicted DNA-binding protein (MmcQ/YjbR family)